MTIPGLKLIDDILAGVPDNARQRKELTELRVQIVALHAEMEKRDVALEDARLQIKALKDKYESPIKADAEKMAVLRLLEPIDRNMRCAEIAQKLGWDANRTHYLLIQLRDAGFVYEVPTGFHIEDAGRIVLHEPS